jgi:hypothetical protein
MSASTPETRARKLPSTAWQPGRSGNPRGRPPAAVDIAALARVHGPRCIEVAVELLDDPDSRIRLGALVALLDRGFGRPKQVIESEGGKSDVQMHLIAAQLVSAEILERQKQPVTINAEPQKQPLSLLDQPPPLE